MARKALTSSVDSSPQRPVPRFSAPIGPIVRMSEGA